ncbi:MAG: histidine phosphatase family protein [Chlamydiae bacterium]|nr:histidine phosphatase family protein [Chlamydiota bacterium]
MRTIFICTRHGETEWNAQGRLQGHRDIPLNLVGIAQANALSTRLQKEHPDLSHIYSSDLQRALQTAQIASGTLKTPLSQEPFLRETFFGPLEGLTREERRQKFGEEFPCLPGMETEQEASSRIYSFLKKLTPLHAGKKVLIVTHGRILHALLSTVDKQKRTSFISNCSITTLLGHYQEDTYELTLF